VEAAIWMGKRHPWIPAFKRQGSNPFLFRMGCLSRSVCPSVLVRRRPLAKKSEANSPARLKRGGVCRFSGGTGEICKVNDARVGWRRFEGYQWEWGDSRTTDRLLDGQRHARATVNPKIK